MTNAETMIEDEENFIAEQLTNAQFKLTILEKQKREHQSKIDQQKAEIETLKQAALDYMQGNGLVSSERFYLKKSTSIEVHDVDALPDAYCRIKREPNKIKIREDMPAGNWYNIKEEFSVCLK